MNPTLIIFFKNVFVLKQYLDSALGVSNFIFHPILLFKRLKSFGINNAVYKIFHSDFSKILLSHTVERNPGMPNPPTVAKKIKFGITAVRGPAKLNLITDSLSSNSFFGGVSTSLILANLLSNELALPLRIVTRTSPANPKVVRNFFTEMELPLEADFELFHFEPNSKNQLPISRHDIFLTTSWWTTEDALSVVPPSQIIYLLQEDERIFYPAGRDYLRAQMVMNNPEIAVVVNTRSLQDHLISSGLQNLRQTSLSFEPSFMKILENRNMSVGNSMKKIFFYARPNHPRNLFALGVDVLESALQMGIIDPKIWEIHFVGYPEQSFTFSNGVTAKVHSPMDYKSYVEFIKTMNIALSLMASPHPSYPVIDLAASGKLVVTNEFIGKMDLTEIISENIIQCIPTSESLVDGLDRAISRFLQMSTLENHFIKSPYSRSWQENFSEVIGFHSAKNRSAHS